MSPTDQAVTVIVSAFEQEPAARWVFSDPLTYRTRFPEFVRAFGGRAFEAGTADVTDGMEGVALWLPPGVQPDEEMLFHLLGTAVDGPRLPEVFALFEQVSAFHPPEPHWYLPLIGVRPEHQGRGHGSELLRRATARCDRDRAVAYLESSNPRNQGLYERHGFRVIGRIQAGSSPEMIAMRRDPA